MQTVWDDADIRGERIEVHCPRCDAHAVVECVAGQRRVTCGTCPYTRPSGPTPPPRHQFSGPVEALASDGLTLWFRCVIDGHDFWALNRQHLAYIRAFVASTERNVEFLIVDGRHPQGDKLPSWLLSAKRRDRTLRALDRLARTPQTPIGPLP